MAGPTTEVVYSSVTAGGCRDRGVVGGEVDIKKEKNEKKKKTELDNNAITKE
jgi:hypothetical protein